MDNETVKIIEQFAEMLAKLIEVIMKFFNSLTGGTEEGEETTAAEG